jgi:hypothetical protein
MRAVWKYELEVTDVLTLSMPGDAEVLTVQMQGSIPCMWALVYPEAPKRDRHFVILGTGYETGVAVTSIGYVGTFQMMGGALVFHVFEVEL